MKLNQSRIWLVGFICAIQLCALDASAQTNNSESKLRYSQKAIPGKYIVVLKQSTGTASTASNESRVSGFASRMITRHGVQLTHTYGAALSGFAVNATEQQAAAIANESDVDYVVEDSVISINATQSPATWGLDRIDQRSLPVNNTYVYDQTGSGVHVYVVDTGIRSTHSEFGGRVSLGYDAIGDGNGAGDCNGHGTHVAGTVGGSTYGVAKSVTLHSVRVLPCSGSGSTSNVIAGINWVTANHSSPAVVNMSLGGSLDVTLNTAVTNSINSGVTYVVAAGNNNSDACSYSPSSAGKVISVGATDSGDVRASYSNIGACVSLFAPGNGIASAWYTSDSATAVLNGTSMASPHVAGVAALYLQANPNASPSEVFNAIERITTYGVVWNNGGSPNQLLFSRPSITNRGALFRYVNNSTGGHFYTTAWTELYGGSVNSWHYEGVEGYLAIANVANTTALYRYYNPTNGDHFYTIYWTELGWGAGGYSLESIAGYAPTIAGTGTANLYRYRSTVNGQHFYTTNWYELGGGSGSWVYEGIASLVWTSP